MTAKQVNNEHYLKETYDVKGRFASYWHQINEVRIIRAQSILEIGVGTGFFAEYLRKRGYSVISLDFDKSLKPSIAASVINLPFCDKAFDIIACFEVLEHLPYADSLQSFDELRRVARNYLIISVPDANGVYPISLRIPFIGDVKRLIPLLPLSKPHNFNGEHYWEIGKKGFPLTKFLTDIMAKGFRVEKTYRVFEMPYHRFLVLKKIE